MGILRNRRGESLISVIIASALLTVIALGVMTAFGQIYASRQAATYHQDAAVFKTNLQNFFTDDASCRSALNGLNYASTVSGSTAPLSFQDLAGNAIVLTSGTQVAPGVRIGQVTFRESTTPVVPPTNFNLMIGGVPQVALEHTVFAQITLDVLVGGQYVSSGQPIVFAIKIVELGGNIIGCANNNGQQDFCVQSGGSIIPGTPTTPGSCSHRSGCTDAGFYSSANAKVPFVNHLTGGYGCPAGSTAYQNGVVAATFSCGKDCLSDGFAPTYACLSCGTDTPYSSSYVAADYSLTSDAMSSLDDKVDDYESAYSQQFDQMLSLYSSTTTTLVSSTTTTVAATTTSTTTTSAPTTTSTTTSTTSTTTTTSAPTTTTSTTTSAPTTTTTTSPPTTTTTLCMTKVCT